jgi:hypothetical protein
MQNISKNVRRHPGKQFVAVTCHSDVVDWLEPDWMFRTDTALMASVCSQHFVDAGFD